MTRRRTTYRRRKSGRAGWTLMECLLAVAIMAIVFAAAAPLLLKASECYSASDPRLAMVNEGRIGLATLARDFREARCLPGASSSTGLAGSTIYYTCDNNQQAFFGLVTNEGTPYKLKYGRDGVKRMLVFNCESLWMTCYGAGETVVPMPGSDPSATRAVDARLTVLDPAGRVDPMTFATRVRIRRNLPTVVINEIMYKPPSALGAKDKNQWVELYNPTAGTIDVAGWRLWTKDQTTPDTLVADALYSTGTGVIPAGGFAVVTDTDSELYREKLNNGDFEKGSMSDWNSTAFWAATVEDKVSGAYSACYSGTGWNCMYQDFKIESAATKARVRVWARKGFGWGTPRVVLRVTNRGSTVFATLYSGACSSEWTAYTADLTPYINRDARLEIWAYRDWGDAYVYVDAAIVHWSKNPNLPLDALHLWVNSSTIGKNLEDAQVFLAQGGRLSDAVVFNNAWGGNGDGTTLSRTTPWAPSTEAEAWKAGPYAGTPAAANP